VDDERQAGSQPCNDTTRWYRAGALSKRKVGSDAAKCKSDRGGKCEVSDVEFPLTPAVQVR
jgi:hypothetical protein